MDGDLKSSPTQIKSVTDFFKQEEPFYLSIGLTHREYWEGEPELARYSLKAFNLKRQREFDDNNYYTWLQGLYNYQACYSAVCLAFNGKEAKRHRIQYPEKPFDFTKKDEGVQLQEEKDKAVKWMAELSKVIKYKFGGGNNAGQTY